MSKDARIPLGVGRLIAQSFGIVFGNPISMGIASVLPMLLGIGLLFLLFVAPRIREVGGVGIGEVLTVWMIALVVCYYVVSLAQVVHDLKLDKPRWHFGYLRNVFVTLPSLLGLSVVLSVLLAIFVMGAFILLAPLISSSEGVFLLALALYLIPVALILASLGVTLPAQIIERAGLKSMMRSLRLTHGYVLPIAGLGVLVVAPALTLILSSSSLAIGLLVTPNENWKLLPIGFAILIAAAAIAVVCAAVTLTYLRLREIKEGYGVPDVVEVFD